MDDKRINGSLERFEGALSGYLSGVDAYSSGVKSSFREGCIILREEASVRITSCEIRLVRVTAVLADSAEGHILQAYFYASPGLVALIVAIYGFIKTVVNVIATINKVIQVITGETLAYWLDKLIPGFQEAWNKIMNKISEFSATLGWGVDGVLHLLNIGSSAANLWGMVTGRDMSAVTIERIEHANNLMQSYSTNLQRWQSNPGEQISTWAQMASTRGYSQGTGFIQNMITKVSSVSEKAEEAVSTIGTITGEFLALRDDMPEFIAKNIPQGLWDSVAKVDTAINDRILPALTLINDRIDEVDAMLEAHRKRAEELADRIAHPGDLLSEIDKLPDYARIEQLGKIDEVTSRMLKEANEAEYAAIEGDLREFSRIVEALSHPPPPVEFLTLELPGKSPGIVAEPRETWFVGDY